MTSIVLVGTYLYYQKVLLHDIERIKEPKIVIFYPIKLKNIELTEQISNINKLPGYIKIENTEFKIIKISTPYTKNIKKTLIFNHLIQKADVISIVNISENKNSILLEQLIPFIIGLEKFGFKLQEQNDNQNNYNIDYEILFGNFSININIEDGKLNNSKLPNPYGEKNIKFGVGMTGGNNMASFLNKDEFFSNELYTSKNNDFINTLLYAIYNSFHKYYQATGIGLNECDLYDEFIDFDSFSRINSYNNKTIIDCYYETKPFFINSLLEETDSTIYLNILLPLLYEKQNLLTKYSAIPETIKNKINNISNICKLTNDNTNNAEKYFCLLNMKEKYNNVFNKNILKSLDQKILDYRSKMILPSSVDYNMKVYDLLLQFDEDTKINKDDSACSSLWNSYFSYLIFKSFLEKRLPIEEEQLLDSIKGMEKITGCKCNEFLGVLNLKSIFKDLTSFKLFLEKVDNLSHYKNEELYKNLFFILQPLFKDKNVLLNRDLKSSIKNFFLEVLKKIKIKPDLHDVLKEIILSDSIPFIYSDEELNAEKFVMKVLSYINKNNIKSNFVGPISNEFFHLIEIDLFKKNNFSTDNYKEILKPQIVRNNLHRFILYEILARATKEETKIQDELINSIETYYPEERNKLKFLNYVFKSAHNNNNKKLLNITLNQIIDKVQSNEKKHFYFFYKDNILNKKPIELYFPKNKKLMSILNNKKDLDILIKHFLGDNAINYLWETTIMQIEKSYKNSNKKKPSNLYICLYLQNYFLYFDKYSTGDFIDKDLFLVLKKYFN